MILRASDRTGRERERERESYQDSSSSQLCMAVLAGPAGRTLRTLSSAQHTDMTISLSLSHRDHRKQKCPPARCRFGLARTSLTAP